MSETRQSIVDRMERISLRTDLRLSTMEKKIDELFEKQDDRETTLYVTLAGLRRERSIIYRTAIVGLSVVIAALILVA